jgi:hypothetical protein
MNETTTTPPPEAEPGSFAALQLAAPLAPALARALDGAGLHDDDAGPGARAAGPAGRPRRDRPGAHRQRQDRRVRAGAADPRRRRARADPGAGAVPDARARRPGRRRDPPPGPLHRQPARRDPVRRGAGAHAEAGAADGAARGRRHAGADPRSPRAREFGARGLRVLVLDEADRMLDMGFLEAITAVVEHAPGVAGPSDAAVLRDLPRRDPDPQPRPAARAADDHRRRRRAQRRRRADILRGPAAGASRTPSRPCCCSTGPSRRWCSARPATTSATSAPARRARLLGAGAARRARAARARRGAAALRQPQLRRAGGDRRGGPRPRHQGPGRGDRVGAAARPRRAPAPHRPHRPRGAAGPRARALFAVRARPGRRARAGPGTCPLGQAAAPRTTSARRGRR